VQQREVLELLGYDNPWMVPVASVVRTLRLVPLEQEAQVLFDN
jgi:hypothetical protein